MYNNRRLKWIGEKAMQLLIRTVETFFTFMLRIVRIRKEKYMQVIFKG